jgi:hypothetical protein
MEQDLVLVLLLVFIKLFAPYLLLPLDLHEMLNFMLSILA